MQIYKDREQAEKYWKENIQSKKYYRNKTDMKVMKQKIKNKCNRK
jgi:hypothetical protein